MDIVKRLQDCWEYDPEMIGDAMREIEQLRKDVQFQARVISRHYVEFSGLHKEIERLRKELAEKNN
jgi:hypothetical protein